MPKPDPWRALSEWYVEFGKMATAYGIREVTPADLDIAEDRRRRGHTPSVVAAELWRPEGAF